MDSLSWDSLRDDAETARVGTQHPLTLTEVRAHVKNSRGDCCAIANGPCKGEISSDSARTLFGCARMPVRVREMSPAIPLAAALAILLGASVTGFIDARNCLTELCFGFNGCCIHRILHGTKFGAANRESRPTRSFNSIRRPKNSRAPPFLRGAAWCAIWRQRPTGGCILLAVAWTKSA